jgi:hypothetical protein
MESARQEFFGKFDSQQDILFHPCYDKSVELFTTKEFI